MSRTSRKSRFVRHLAAALLLALPGAALRAEPHIDPALAPLLQNPAAPIPAAVSRPGLTRRGDRRIQGEPTLDLFLRTTASRASLEAMGLRVRTLRGGRATATVPVSALAALAARPDVQLITVSRPLRPQLDKSVPQTGATWLRTESAGSFTGRTGDGVLIGFIDSGIDYDHPDFLDASGNSRVLAIWDQQTTGTAPAAFGYGNECTQTDILAGTCSEVDDADREGHGTHVAGIAAGSGAAPDASGATYLTTGMAPGASIAVVKTDFTVNGTIDGLTYLFDLADSLDLPAVVNISLGTHLGAHGGTHPIEQEIDALVGAAPGRAVVVAAGNYAATPIHAEVHAVAAMSIVAPTFEVPRYTRTSGTDEVEITGYYPATDNLTVHLWSPSGLHYEKGLNPFPGLSGCVRDLTGADGAVTLCNKTSSVIGDGTTDNEIYVHIFDSDPATPPAQGTWTMALTGTTVTGSGEVDFWMESTMDATFTSDVDTSETLSQPATSAAAIAVGAYTSRWCWYAPSGDAYSFDQTDEEGDITAFSSRGPTRDGRQKPDLAAPGQAILSSLAAEVLSSVSSAHTTLDDNHQMMAGTSQAAPHVTGAVALLLEDDPTLSSTTIKSLLQSNAREDRWTDAYAAPGFLTTTNHTFGAGKLDLGGWAWVDPYETNDTLATARDLLSGATIAGYIEHTDDVDLFHLGEANSGDTVDVTLTSLPADYALAAQRSWTPSFAFCPETSLVTTVASDNTGTADESLSYTPSLLTQARYLRVESSAGATSSTDSYSLKAVITRPETSAVHNTTATAQALPRHVEFKVAGSSASAFETDTYSLQAQAGQTITAKPGALRTAQILNASGAVVATGTPATYTVPVTTPGTRTFYVTVSGAVGSYTLTTTVN